MLFVLTSNTSCMYFKDYYAINNFVGVCFIKRIDKPKINNKTVYQAVSRVYLSFD